MHRRGTTTGPTRALPPALCGLLLGAALLALAVPVSADLQDARKAYDEAAAAAQAATQQRLAAERAQYAAEMQALGALPPLDRVGRFSLDRDTALGRHVALTLDPAACALRDVRVQGLAVLASVAHNAAPEPQPARVRLDAGGLVLRMRCADGAELLVTDHPAAALRATAGSAGGFTWTPSFEASTGGWAPPGAPPTGFDLAVADLRARVAFAGASRVSPEGAWTAAEGLLVATGQDVVLPGAANGDREGLAVSAARRGLLGEVVVIASSQGPVVVPLAFGPLGVGAQPGAPSSDLPAQERPVVTLDVAPSETGGPATLAFHVDRALFPDWEPGGVLGSTPPRLRLASPTERGTDEVPVSPASGGRADALDPTDDAGPESWAGRSDDGAQMLVSLPRAAPLRVMFLSPLPLLTQVPPVVLAGTAAGAMLVVVAVVFLVRRSRRTAP